MTLAAENSVSFFLSFFFSSNCVLSVGQSLSFVLRMRVCTGNMRAESCGKEDQGGKVGGGWRGGRTGTMGGGERSEAWAGGEGRQG